MTGGHIGPARAKLLAGRDLELFGADEIDEALAAVATMEPRVCIFRYQLAFGTVVELLERLRADGVALPPFLVVLAEEEWSHLDAVVEAGATDVLELADVDQIIHTVAKHLGMHFGRGPRAKIETRAEIFVVERWHELVTADLRPTGIAVVDAPASVDVGLRFRVKVDILDYTLEAWALVARSWEREGLNLSGLQLVGLTQQQRIYLEAAVATLRVGKQDSYAPDAASEETVEEGGASSTIRWHLEQLLLGKGERGEHPPWLYGVVPELTPIERSAVLGVDVPSWAHHSVKIRIALAQYRDDCPVGPPPTAITDACQKLFNIIANDVEDAEDFDVGEQISMIKGRFIREFLDGPEASGPGEEFGAGFAPRFDLPPPPPLSLAKPRPVPPPGVKLLSKPGREELAPPPVAAFARSAFAPLWLCAALALIFAIAVRVMSAEAPDRSLVELPANDLATPVLSSMTVATDFGSAQVTGEWITRTHDERVEILLSLRKKLLAWEMPVRFIVVHSEEGVPIALFDYESSRLLELEQPLHLVITERTP